jgi:hypothetical protein
LPTLYSGLHRSLIDQAVLPVKQGWIIGSAPVGTVFHRTQLAVLVGDVGGKEDSRYTFQGTHQIAVGQVHTNFSRLDGGSKGVFQNRVRPLCFHEPIHAAPPGVELRAAGHDKRKHTLDLVQIDAQDPA